MSKKVLNTGTQANDKTGDSLRDAATKINDNFQEVYYYLGDGTNLTVASVAKTGSYNSLLDKPNLDAYLLRAQAFSGSYNDLTNKPTITVNYNELVNKPDLTQFQTKSEAFTGDYQVLTNKPDFSIYALKSYVTWGNIAQKPTFSTVAYSGDYNDLQNRPTLFSGSYADLTNKPDFSVYQLTENAFNGDWNSLANRPTLFTGSYTDLTNKPIIPADVSDLTDNEGLLSGGVTQLTNLTGSVKVQTGAINNTDIPANTWEFKDNGHLSLPRAVGSSSPAIIESEGSIMLLAQGQGGYYFSGAQLSLPGTLRFNDGTIQSTAYDSYNVKAVAQIAQVGSQFDISTNYNSISGNNLTYYWNNAPQALVNAGDVTGWTVAIGSGYKHNITASTYDSGSNIYTITVEGGHGSIDILENTSFTFTSPDYVAAHDKSVRVLTGGNTWEFNSDGDLVLAHEGTIVGHHNEAVGTQIVMQTPGFQLPFPPAANQIFVVANETTAAITSGMTATFSTSNATYNIFGSILSDDESYYIITFDQDIAYNTSADTFPVAFSSMDYVAAYNDDVKVKSNDHTWNFRKDGKLVFPNGSTQDGGSISVAALKTLVAASASFTDFQSRIAAL